MFSSGADFVAIGQSILSSSLLSPTETLQWLKPVSHTPDLRLAVGMPWEIFRIDVPVVGYSTRPGPARVADLYAKNGGIAGYLAQIALSPDHGFGWALFQAGQPSTDGPDRQFGQFQFINEKVTQNFVPAFEAAGAEQARHNFAGVYSANDGSNMTLTVVAGDGGLGLGVRNWTTGGRDILKAYYGLLSGSLDFEGEPRLRLYPAGMQDDTQVGFRGVYEKPGNTTNFSDGAAPFLKICGAWASIAEPAYGNIGLDDFVFTVDREGKGTAITARGARKTMYRQPEIRN